MSYDLTGRVAVVTGSTKGIGRAMAQGLAEAGASVVVSSRKQELCDQVAEEITSTTGADTFGRACHVGDWDAIPGFVDAVVERFGRIDVLVNNAGISPSRAGVSEMTLDLWRKIFAVNLEGPLRMSQCVAPVMRDNGGGSIINIGSLYASVSPDQRFYDHLAGAPPFLKSPAYGASKAAVVNMTKYFATLWGPRGVRVNTLSPGGVLGGQDESFKTKYGARVPLGRMASTEDLKGPLVFLASSASSYVTGHELRVDGGFTAW